VDTISLAIDHQFTESRCMGSESTQISGPPLGSGRCWAINDEFVCVSVEGRSGFQGGDIGTVTEFCLAIAPEDLMVYDER
jgi:hypothetical protein